MEWLGAVKSCSGLMFRLICLNVECTEFEGKYNVTFALLMVFSYTINENVNLNKNSYESVEHKLEIKILSRSKINITKFAAAGGIKL